MEEEKEIERRVFFLKMPSVGFPIVSRLRVGLTGSPKKPFSRTQSYYDGKNTFTLLSPLQDRRQATVSGIDFGYFGLGGSGALSGFLILFSFSQFFLFIPASFLFQSAFTARLRVEAYYKS